MFIAGMLTVLALALALIGWGSTDITQIMSQVTALVAMYVIKQPPPDGTRL
ncbi:hypothetical protein [Microtetraspora malaysiensis]|uniref:Uncharacterized protein n=1 Tax=Microtetraspora malaysiensis TaxID=161358 RepID=A0ABW6SUG5_9ACTN